MKDRIIQHAIMIYLEPIFRETFILDTFSSIKTRGIHLGLKRVKHYINHCDDDYILKLDIHKCYPSLDQNILKQKLAKKFNDDKLLRLLYKIIDSCPKGVPIGNYTSQYFNNFYFNDFDHWIKEVKGIKGYFRYCDDIVIIHKDKEFLHNLLEEIKVKISELNIKLKPNYQIYKISYSGIDFLGYIIHRDYIKVRKNTKQNFINKVSKMDFNNLTAKDINVLGSYWGIFVHADCRHLWETYTGVKTFKDLNIKVHNRDFVKDVLDKEIIVNSAVIYYRKGEKRVRLCVTYDTIEDVYISTSAEMIIEAIEQLNINHYPFKTIIKVNDKGYYMFT